MNQSVLRALLKQFTSPIVLILFLATLISMVTGDVIDGLIILAIIIPSGLLSFAQEHRAGKVMQTLLQQLKTQVRVIRAGIEQLIDSEEIAVGDIVVLKAGDLVPADLIVTESEKLMADESSFTGESFPVEKVVGGSQPALRISERTSELFFGTHIISGSGQAIVQKIGRDTEFGALEEKLGAIDLKTSFEVGIEKFGILLARAMAVLVVAIFIINISFHRPLLESLLFSLALAVGLTPQLLPAIVSVSLASGAKLMASKKVLVKRLDVIEDLGSMTALCTDKTGTLTMGVVELNGAIDLSGNKSADVLHLAVLNASLQKSFPNPLDQTIIKAAPVVNTENLVSEIPYDFNRRRLSVLTSSGLLISKGAFTSVLEISTSALVDGKVIPISEARPALQRRFEDLSAQGARVIAVASKEFSGSTLTPNDESSLVLQGLLIFMDPPKEDAAASIAEIRELGIETFLITGDNPQAARTIAGKVGLANDEVLDGKAVASLTDAQLKERLATVRVFAEVDPLQKERIVRMLRELGHTVGYFGDGINDSAALKSADVGISVDTAVNVARSAAAVVLLDRDLHVLADGVRIGRKTFLNTMKYIQVGVSAAFGNMLSMAVASLFLPYLPLLPIQILLLNFLSDFPALTIAGDKADPEILQTPRIWDITYIRRFMLVFGGISSVFDLLTFAIMKIGFNADEVLFRSGWFVESTLTELVVMLVLRTHRPFWKSRPGTGLLLSSVVLAAIVMALPFTVIGHSLQIDAIPLKLIYSLTVLIITYALVNEVVKRWFNGSSQKSGATL